MKATKDIRGHYEYLSNGPLLARVWVDKRCVGRQTLCVFCGYYACG